MPLSSCALILLTFGVSNDLIQLFIIQRRAQAADRFIRQTFRHQRQRVADAF